MQKIVCTFFLLSILCVSQVSQAQTCIPMPDVFAPITQNVADNVKNIVDNGLDRNPDVFAIVGDSNSSGGGISSYYLGNCEYPYTVNGTDYGWVGVKDIRCYPDLKDSLDFFLEGNVPGANTPFTRNSLAAYSGRTAAWAVTGSISPLQQEINAINPQYALIMFGSNDVYGIDADETWLLEEIVDDLMAIADACIAQGVVPIFKSAPNHSGYPEQMYILSQYLKDACAERSLPFIDVYAATYPLPNHGQGTDGIHFRYSQYNRMCVFNQATLAYGVNMHNLLTLQMLDYMYQIVEQDVPCIDCEIDTVDTDTGSIIDTGSADTGSVDTGVDTGSEVIYVNPCTPGFGHDNDLDGVCSCVDNCPVIYNPIQEDADSDSMGNVCDSL